jgi:enamine deaminase RidA (YjgF/YER057c/UK114 family)
MKEYLSSGATYEAKFGYSRAVKVDGLVFMLATAGTDNIGSVADTYNQTRRSFEKIQVALVGAGGTLRDVARLRVFAKQELVLSEFRRAYQEFFAPIKPALSLIYVSGFPDPAALLEVEAEAMIDQSPKR